MRKYFLHDGENQQGPFTVEQLMQQGIKKDTPVWYEGLPEWLPASNIDELSNLFVSIPTPPPFKKDAASPPSINVSIDPTEQAVSNSKSKRVLYIGIASIVLLAGAIIAWLVYQNNQHVESISEVQQQLSQQQLEQQNKEFQQQLAAERQQQQMQNQQAEKNRINEELTEKYMGYRNNWRTYISASSNTYTYSELGGISNLAVVVNNLTDRTVDEVQVRVDYIKANGGLYKSETVVVTNIGPGSSKSVYAPESDRGVSVRMEIESIMAKSFHFCYPYGMPGNQDFDPFFCK